MGNPVKTVCIFFSDGSLFTLGNRVFFHSIFVSTSMRPGAFGVVFLYTLKAKQTHP